MNLFVFGLGYTAGRFVSQNRASFDAVSATVRSIDRPRRGGEAADLFRFDPAEADPHIEPRLTEADALLVSVQPGDRTDPVLARFGAAIEAAPRIGGIVYLSTIGVYGDHGGAWIDETAATEADNPRQRARIQAERDWLALGARAGKPVTILRLAGIYGPGRNALDDLRAGEARRIDKPGQVFNRIHVDDIGRAIAAAIAGHGSTPVCNVTDDEPAPAPDVVAFAAALLGVESPPLVPFAQAELSPMARSFYGANRRVLNDRLKRQLGVALAYPTYREGLRALAQDAARERVTD